MARTQALTHRRLKWGSVGTYASFVLFAFIVLLPIYWMLRSAFTLAPDLIKVPLIYFPDPTL
jgi:ABC-type glycerol-3-phosphate transport system permease component